MSADFFDRHRGRRALFGDDVAAYDYGRPDYPERVYELLRLRGGLNDWSQVLEIGPGTGQATRRLLELGGSVTAIELSEALASWLKAKHGHSELDLVVGAFEDVELPGKSFDLVVAATSFHWVPTDVGLQRCASLLATGGSLALWWTVFGDPSRQDPFHEALTPILRRLAPELLDTPDRRGNAPFYALDVKARVSEIEGSGSFGPVFNETISWTGGHTPEQLRALFSSYSSWRAIPADRRTVVLDALEAVAREEFGGVVERPYLTPIYMSRRLPGPH